MITRRQFVKLAVAACAASAAPWPPGLRMAQAAALPQTPLAAGAIRQFVDPVPDLMDADHLIADDGKTPIELVMREHRAMVLPDGTVPGYAGTYVWSYLRPAQTTRASYVGPLIATVRGRPTEVKFVNRLGSAATTNVLAYKHSTDQTLPWADPLGARANRRPGVPRPGSAGANNYAGPIPTSVHLHGGEVPSLLDGNPNAWFTSDAAVKGSRFYSKGGVAAANYSVCRYPNSQESALLWFHDQALGAARLNLYAGLAGAYLITDPLNDPAGLPPLVPLVIQDRTFDEAGQLFFPAAGAPNPEHPYWIPEFFGDVNVVNGKSWPFMDVEQRRYTFLFVNASITRTYELSLTDPASGNPGPPMWVIGTDGGYLDVPQRINPAGVANRVLPIAPGERYWVMVDFAGYGAGAFGTNGIAYSGNWILKNGARAPYPSGPALKASPVSRVMQFRVTPGAVADGSYNPALGGQLRRPMVRLAGVPAQKLRRLTLNEVAGPASRRLDPVTGAMATFAGGPLEILLNNTRWEGRRRAAGVDPVEGLANENPIPGLTRDGVIGTYTSELPNEGETEIWEIINMTGGAHPLHLHLAQFQLLGRRKYNVAEYSAAYAAAFTGGYDYVKDETVGPGVYIPAFGPPLTYLVSGASGGSAPAGADAAPGMGGQGQPAGMGSAGGSSPNAGPVGGNPDVTPFFQGPDMAPLPHENGWKDTVIAFPGQVTRICVRWAPTDLATGVDPAELKFPFNPGGKPGYVWNCSAAAHGDNAMMRPAEVLAKGAKRVYVQGVDY